MAIINNINEVLHRIRAKLYPNHLQGIQGTYIAHTDVEASLNSEQVCAALCPNGTSVIASAAKQSINGWGTQVFVFISPFVRAVKEPAVGR